METPLDSTNLLLRGGKIIPSLPTNGVKNLYEARQNSVSLIVGLDSNGQASGVYYVDDGLSLDTLTSNKYTKYTVNVQPNQGKLLLTIKSDVRGYGETLR